MQTMNQHIESNVKKSLKTLTNLLMDFNVTRTIPILGISDIDTGFDNKLSMVMIHIKFEVDVDDQFASTIMDQLKTLLKKLESILTRFGFTELGTIAKQPKEFAPLLYGGLLTDKIMFNHEDDFILLEFDAMFS